MLFRSGSGVGNVLQEGGHGTHGDERGREPVPVENEAPLLEAIEVERPPENTASPEKAAQSPEHEA